MTRIGLGNQAVMTIQLNTNQLRGKHGKSTAHQHQQQALAE
jgi:hypothetical protein